MGHQAISRKRYKEILHINSKSADDCTMSSCRSKVKKDTAVFRPQSTRLLDQVREVIYLTDVTHSSFIAAYHRT